MRSGAAVVLAVIVLASCGTQEDATSDRYGLTAETRGNRSISRSWIEPGIKEVALLSSGEGYTLFEPRALRILDDGNILVFDYGDYTIKAFNREGKYVATYGQGRGRGPGQMMTMTNSGVRRDSLVYIVDPRQRRVSFFMRNGEFVRSENYKVPFYRLAWAEDSTKYMVPPPQPGRPFLKIETSNRKLSISGGPVRGVDEIMFSGYLHTSRRKAIYVPLYLPVLLTYTPNDTTGIAHPTPDYGRSLPIPEKTDRPPSKDLNGPSTVSGDILTVQHPTPEVDSLMFDLYDVGKMKYTHSIRVPVDGEKSVYAHGTGTIASIRDTTVAIYSVSPVQK